MTSLISIAIRIGLNYLSIFKSRLLFIITKFVTRGAL